LHILNDYNNIKQCRSELQIGTDIPLNPNSRQRKKSGPTFSAFLKKAFFFEGGGQFSGIEFGIDSYSFGLKKSNGVVRF